MVGGENTVKEEVCNPICINKDEIEMKSLLFHHSSL
jgi:hypothetical protein